MDRRLKSTIRAGALWAIALLASSFPLMGQTTSAWNADLRGMSGEMSILPNSTLRQVVVAFTSSTPINATSSQIVFVLQSESPKQPAAWSGMGRVLVGSGVLIVVPTDGHRGAPISAFKFSDQPIPASVRGWSMENYGVYGIARYGETSPLSNDQIQELAAKGRYTKAPTVNFSPNALRSNPT
jgi:hypothetical protein